MLSALLFGCGELTSPDVPLVPDVWCELAVLDEEPEVDVCDEDVCEEPDADEVDVEVWDELEVDLCAEPCDDDDFDD